MNIASRFVALLVLPVAIAAFSPAYGQDDADAALEEAHKAFVEVLENTNNIFYKVQTNEAGATFYSILWDLDGETTRFIFNIKLHGTYGGRPIFGISAWTIVGQSEEAVPPAVIKAIATVNDRLLLGNISCSEDFTTVYANLTATADELTPGALWLYCAYLQENVKSMKAIMEEATTGSK